MGNGKSIANVEKVKVETTSMGGLEGIVTSLINREGFRNTLRENDLFMEVVDLYELLGAFKRELGAEKLEKYRDSDMYNISFKGNTISYSEQGDLTRIGFGSFVFPEVVIEYDQNIGKYTVSSRKYNEDSGEWTDSIRVELAESMLEPETA